MYAIVEHSGCQKKVVQGEKYWFDSISSDVDAEIVFDKVVLVKKEKSLDVGQPYCKKVSVKGKILKHARGEKINVRHFKRRKHHMKCMGHRQNYTQVEIVSIGQ